MNSAQEIAAGILGEIDWQPGAGFGYCRCPGSSFHQNRAGKRDTRVYIEGAPTITCFHSSCGGAVEEANRVLRSRIGLLERGSAVVYRPLEKSPEQLVREREKATAARLAAEARNALPVILKQFPWSLADIWHQSVESLDDVEDDWRRLLCLFAPDDLVWIGDKFDSGKPEHASHFRTATDWMSKAGCPSGPHVSPFAYLPGTVSRKAANVRARKFLVVESDSHGRDDQGAILRWLRDALGLHLRAVIDTMGRSIHGWFDVPDDAVLKDLASVLPALGCDPALLRPTQVSRLPSCRRGSKIQGLLYLDCGNGGGNQ